MSEQAPSGANEPSPTTSERQSSRKRSNQATIDAKYPRKRSLKACHVCRARKTKCDNVRPVCGFCRSINISCSYDDTEKDHSTFDPASLEILRQLGQIISSQDDLLALVSSVASPPARGTPSLQASSSSVPIHAYTHDSNTSLNWDNGCEIRRQQQQQQQQQHAYSPTVDWYTQLQPDSPSTTPGETSVAAVRWFGLLAKFPSQDAIEEQDALPGQESGFLDLFSGQNEDEMTSLQKATKIIDDSHPPEDHLSGESLPEESMWRASENISLLDREQISFEHFLHRICSWFDLFDPARNFSTRVPHLAIRNAGLLNAILALSNYHQSLGEHMMHEQRESEQHKALQYYYQTLHYVQKAMRYPTYQNSLELMSTTLIVSTYEMLRGSRKDWQQHLKGVFWILRSRQIEVEASSLESTTWWAWLCQDIWVAFRERRRTYSTWVPKKGYPELSGYELACRSVWIMAKVVNFCAADEADDDVSYSKRLAWSKALRKMLHEWESHLTVEFSQLPTARYDDADGFKPRMIHPQCFGLAIQIHHISRILICAHEPNVGSFESFLGRQKTIQDSVQVVCGIAMTVTDDASSMMSSQCLFIAGMFIQNPGQRRRVIEMLESRRSSWPTPSLVSELQETWNSHGCSWQSP